MFYASTHGMHADASVENLNNDTTVGPLQRRWVRPVHVLAPHLGRRSRGLLGRPRPLLVLERLHQRPQPGISLAGVGRRDVFNDERLKAYTADFEVTRAFCCGMSKVNFFLGGRYASFEAGEGLDVSRLTSPTEITYSNAFTDFSFNGLGITTGFFGRTPIGCDTCISLVWGLRGSVLWGNANRAVQTSDSNVDSGSDATSHQLRPVERMRRRRSLSKPSWVRNGTTSCAACPCPRSCGWPPSTNTGISAPAAACQHLSFADDSPGLAVSSGSVGDVKLNLVGLKVGAGFNW